MNIHGCKITKHTQNALWTIYQIIYFILFTSIIITSFSSGAMFKSIFALRPYFSLIEIIVDTLIPAVIAINIVFIFLSQLGITDKNFDWTFSEGLIAIFVCGCLVCVHFITRRYEEPLWFAVLILGAHNIEYKKLLKAYFTIMLILCMVTIICSLTGNIENLIYYRGTGERRISFGFTYPTDCCSHFFFLCVIWTFIRNKKTSFVEVLIFALVAVFAYVFCNARTTFVTLLLLCLWISWTKIKPKLQKKDEYYMPKIIRIISYFSGIIATGTMIILSTFYNTESKFYLFINRLLSDRIRLSNLGFKKYSVTLLGQSVKMNGNGGSTNVVKDYFFLDSSYINTLLRYGAITLIIVLGILLFLMLCENNKKNYMLIGVIFIVIIQCTIEHHLIEIGHCPILLLLFTAEYSTKNLPACLKKVVKHEKISIE